MSRFTAFLLLFVVGLMPFGARANCIYVTSDGLVPTFEFHPSASVTVNASAPVGTVLWSWQGTQAVAKNPKDQAVLGWPGLDSVGWACQADWSPTYPIGTYPGTVRAGITTYGTNVPGIGVQITLGGNMMFPFSLSGGSPARSPFPGYPSVGNTNPSALLRVDLIKTGPITGGTLSGEFAQWSDPQNGAGAEIVSYTWGPGIPIIPNTPSCTIDGANSPVQVTLPDQSVAGFSGIGTTAGPQKDFTINLNCGGGDPGTSSGVYITLTDATNPQNVSDMLSPTAATAGTGVGIRIFKAGVPVSYGPDLATVGNTNQWGLGSVTPVNTALAIPLTAQYVQVGSTVQGGVVQAIATFTLAYN